MTIQSRVFTTIASIMGIPAESVHPNSTFETLGADSLQIMEIVMALEEEFHCEISDDDLEKINSVQDIINLMEKAEGCHAILQ